MRNLLVFSTLYFAISWIIAPAYAINMSPINPTFTPVQAQLTRLKKTNQADTASIIMNPSLPLTDYKLVPDLNVLNRDSDYDYFPAGNGGKYLIMTTEKNSAVIVDLQLITPAANESSSATWMTLNPMPIPAPRTYKVPYDIIYTSCNGESNAQTYNLSTCFVSGSGSGGSCIGNHTVSIPNSQTNWVSACIGTAPGKLTLRRLAIAGPMPYAGNYTSSVELVATLE